MYKTRGAVLSEVRGDAADTFAVTADRLRSFGGRILSAFAPAAFILASVFAVAQNPACPPNTAVYPCVYVANESSGNVSVINANTNMVVGTVTVGNAPRGLAVTPDNAFVYVADGTFTFSVAVIDTATGTTRATVTGPKGSSAQVAITPDGKYAYVVDPEILRIERIDTATNTVVDSIAGTNTNPSAVAIAPNGLLAFVADQCTGGACVDIVDTTSTPPAVSSSILIPNFTGTGSIAVTPDGSLVCVTVVDPNLKVGVACINTTTDSQTELDLGDFLGLTNYGMAITPSGTMFAAEPGEPTDPMSFVASINPNTTPPTLLSTIQVGVAPTGVAAGPGGTSVYITNANDNTVSVIDAATATVILTLGSGNGFDNPQGVAAMTASPPVIATQPVNQVIFTGQTATLNIVVTSAALVSYQWYQGVAGDTSAPIAGAVGGAFTTPPLNSSTTYWVQVTNIAGTVSSNTASVTVTPASPPVITTQPTSQLILTGQTATLSVVASSVAPLSYQWYQGQSGDTSIPIEGAVGSSFTTPVLTASTSYWAQVTNVEGAVNSNTATVTVTSDQPPTCTLSVAGAGSQTFTNPLAVIATATCSDPQSEALTTTIDFGDKASKSGANSGVFVASHTYAAYTQLTTYPIVVTATDVSELQSAPAEYSWTLVPTVLAPPVFSGQSSDVTVTLALPSNSTLAQVQVQFECTTVTTDSGAPMPASLFGIDCSSSPSTITLTTKPQPVTIVIQTTGGASAQVPGMRQGMRDAFWVCLPILFLLALGLSPVRSRDRQFSFGLALNGLIVFALLSVSCGGGFTAPKVQQVTPPGNYQVTVVDLPANGVQPSGFVQTSLIVPLTVSPFQ